MLLHAVIIFFALAAASEAGISCSLTTPSWTVQKNHITTWPCEQTPIPNQMQWEVTNLFGWTISTYVSSGGNGCSSGSPDQQYQPEGTIRDHRLRNATASTIGCPDFPCCLRILCSGSNNADCSGIGVKVVFFNPNPMSESGGVDITNNITTVKLD